MLEIRVGNRYATLVDQDEADLHMMPHELVAWFKSWYNPCRDRLHRLHLNIRAACTDDTG